MDDCIVDQREEVPLLCCGGIIAIEEQVANDRHLRRSAGVIAPRNCGRTVRGVAVLVRVKENVAFNPGVGAIQIEDIVRGSAEHVIVELDNGLPVIPVSAGKIHDVVIPAGRAEETIPHDSMTPCFDAAGAVHEFKRRAARRKVAMADDERAIIEGYVLMAGRSE